MPKLNFEQSRPASRDVGGPSGGVILVVAIVACAVWAAELLLHGLP